MVPPKSSLLFQLAASNSAIIEIRGPLWSIYTVLDIVLLHRVLCNPHKDHEKEALIIPNFVDKKLGLGEVK